MSRGDFALTCVAVRREQRLLQAHQIDHDGAENESGEEHHSLETAVTCGQTRISSLLHVIILRPVAHIVGKV